MIRAFSAGGGVDGLDGGGQRVGGGQQLVDLRAAAAQRGEVRLEARALVVGQRAEQVGGDGVGPALVIVVRRLHQRVTAPPES